MNDQYEECGWTSEKLADEELFIREVIREDTDVGGLLAQRGFQKVSPSN